MRASERKRRSGRQTHDGAGSKGCMPQVHLQASQAGVSSRENEVSQHVLCSTRTIRS